MQNFLLKNKVFILGLLGSIGVVIQQYTGTPDVDYKIVGFAVLMAVLSFVSNQWRGQGITMLGIFGTLAGAFVSVTQTGKFTWMQFIIYSVAALLSAVAPPPKPQTYESNSAIVEAKEKPPVDQVVDDTKLPVGVDTDAKDDTVKPH